MVTSKHLQKQATWILIAQNLENKNSKIQIVKVSFIWSSRFQVQAKNSRISFLLKWEGIDTVQYTEIEVKLNVWAVWVKYCSCCTGSEAD